MAVIPVTLKTRDSDQSVLTYLDNGGNSSFCTESLVKQLGVNGHQVKISLSTLEKKNSVTNSFLVRDLVSDLDENEWISLLTLYIRPEIPVWSSDILTQGDVDKWPHLPRLHAEVDLLIASDVPKARRFPTKFEH